jgi:hypothetical protein
MPTFHVVPAESPVLIDARSSVHPVRAQSRELSGTVTVELDPAGRPELAAPYAAHLRLPVESIHSGHSLQDREMYRRLDTRRHPDITVELTEAVAVDGDRRYRARARIGVRGQVQLVEGEVTVATEGDRLLVEGEKTIDMRIFGMEPPRLLMLKVEPEFLVRVRITAQRGS